MAILNITITNNEDDGSITITDNDDNTRLYLGFSGQESSVEFDGDGFRIIIDDMNDQDSLLEIREATSKLFSFMDPNSFFEEMTEEESLKALEAYNQ